MDLRSLAVLALRQWLKSILSQATYQILTTSGEQSIQLSKVLSSSLLSSQPHAS